MDSRIVNEPVEVNDTLERVNVTLDKVNTNLERMIALMEAMVIPPASKSRNTDNSPPFGVR